MSEPQQHLEECSFSKQNIAAGDAACAGAGAWLTLEAWARARSPGAPLNPGRPQSGADGTGRPTRACGALSILCSHRPSTFEIYVLMPHSP